MNAFDPVAKMLHWAVALMILGLLVLGPLMTEGDWTPEVRHALFTAHKTAGLLVLFLGLVRLYWRWRHPAPPFPPMPRWQTRMARATHGSLFLLTVLVPLVGWALVSTGPYGIQLFGVIPFPSLPLPQGQEGLGPFLGEAHETLASLMAMLIVLHVGGAFMHHFVDRDNVLLRMSPIWSHRFLNRLRGER